MDEHKKTKKDWMLPVSIVIAALSVSLALVYNAGKSTANAGKNSQDATIANVAKTPIKPDVGSDDPQIGKVDAPVTIIMFSDPSCPFCGAAAGGNEQVMAYLKSRDSSWEPSIPAIIKNYVNTGKVRLVYKYFVGHGTGEQAMKVLFCANDQGKFWPLHDVIAKNQDVVEDITKIKGFATSVGVEGGALDACLSSKKYDAKLQKDFDSGRAAGVEGTPAFFVNDTFISGAVSYATMKSAIEAALQK